MKIRTIAAPIALTGVLVLAGCGSSDQSTATGGQEGDFQQALSAYVACLKDNGVTVTLPSGGPAGFGGAGGQRPSGAPTGRPDGGTAPDGAPTGRGQRGPGGFLAKPDGVSQQTWQAAQTACAGELPQGRFGPGGSAPMPSATS